MRQVVSWLVVLVGVAVMGGATPRVLAQDKKPSVSAGWVKLPEAGATSTTGFATVENPGMYAFYLISATSDVAASVELRQAGKDAALDEVTVPAYGTLDMSATGYHLLLKGLKKPLAEGDKVNVTVVNELGEKLSVEATVKKQ